MRETARLLEEAAGEAERGHAERAHEKLGEAKISFQTARAGIRKERERAAARRRSQKDA